MKKMDGKETRHCIRVPKIYDWVSRHSQIPLLQLTDMSIFPSQLEGNLRFECFLSDEEGNRLNPLSKNSISCSEIPPKSGSRPNVITTLRSGKTVTLQKVKIQIKGFIVIIAKGNNGTFISEPIEWSVVETFLLCAPDGTHVVCHISHFECDVMAFYNPEGSIIQIDLSIDLCEEVQAEAMVKIGLFAEFMKLEKRIIKKKIVIEKEEEEE